MSESLVVSETVYTYPQPTDGLDNKSECSSLAKHVVGWDGSCQNMRFAVVEVTTHLNFLEQRLRVASDWQAPGDMIYPKARIGVQRPFSWRVCCNLDSCFFRFTVRTVKRNKRESSLCGLNFF